MVILDSYVNLITNQKVNHQTSFIDLYSWYV